MTAIRRISRRSFGVMAAGAGLSGLASRSFAQGYPERPVKIVVPFAAGGPSDIMARTIATRLGESTGKSFIIENVGGAGGNVGMGNVARSAPDGYTVLMASSSYVVNPSLYTNSPYDPHKDFHPISNVGVSTHAFFVHPSVPVKTMKELVAYIKANPGKQSYGSAGSGTVPHLVGELFKLEQGLDLAHVPFRGGGPAAQAVMSGHVPIGCVTLPPVSELIKAGKLRALAVTSASRVPSVPDIPTISEAGFPSLLSSTWQGVFVPAGTPQAIRDYLFNEISKVVKAPGMNEHLIKLGFTANMSKPAEFTEQIKVEVAKWQKVIKAGSIKP